MSRDVKRQWGLGWGRFAKIPMTKAEAGLWENSRAGFWPCEYCAVGGAMG